MTRTNGLSVQHIPVLPWDRGSKGEEFSPPCYTQILLSLLPLTPTSHSYLSLLPLTPTSHSYLSLLPLTASHNLSQPINTSHNLSQPITTSHYLSQSLVTSHILSQPLDSPLTKGLGTQYTHIYHLLPDSTIQSQCGNGGDYFLHIQNYNNKHRPPHDLLSAFWALLTCY